MAVDFDKVAATLRWKPRSIAVVRAVLVDGMAISKAAADHDMTTQQANVLKTRFLAKGDKIRVQEFKARVPPDSPPLSALKSHASTLVQLHSEGYTPKQLAAFLDEQHGLKVSQATIREFLAEVSK